ncbi:hypothetical protein F442_09602 [Phytophthora nicotianae P10297]|uniref:Uncharacterized protein n=1 Tax=Phytophthora nicotianae P10297 TaxID=1317064 RepID=W2Z9J6_PHYNI|nr:hypothetical protein F442_09602 [Phytophthora nicotianae P10297]
MYTANIALRIRFLHVGVRWRWHCHDKADKSEHTRHSRLGLFMIDIRICCWRKLYACFRRNPFRFAVSSTSSAKKYLCMFREPRSLRKGDTFWNPFAMTALPGSRWRIAGCHSEGGQHDQSISLFLSTPKEAAFAARNTHIGVLHRASWRPS